MTREEYFEFIDTPKHIGANSKLFDSNFLEMFSSSPWWMVPIGVIPLLWRCDQFIEEYNALALTLILGGFFIWFLLEYLFHRFIFHCEKRMPDHGAFLLLHFFLHGLHHAFPTDPGRLVLPPAVLYILYFFLSQPFYFLLPNWAFYRFLFGAVIGYVAYDLTHYYLHHSTPKLESLKF